MTPEFSRLVATETIGEPPRSLSIEAGEAERAGLARRFDLEAIDRLAATLRLSRIAGGVLVEGQVEAAVVQRCIATAAALPATISEPVHLVFADDVRQDEEIELAEPDLDTLPIENGTIDLGEAAAETMALALDPYPRAPDADEVLRRAGIKAEGEEETGPFAALAALRDTLGGSAP